MRSEDKTCDGCIWHEQCGGDPCDDYSPVSDEEEMTSVITYYGSVLEEDDDEYQQVVLLYADYGDRS